MNVKKETIEAGGYRLLLGDDNDDIKVKLSL
jgi:hypothetical protein